MAFVGRFLIALVAVGALFSMVGGPAEAANTKLAAGNFWFCDSSYAGGVCPTTITQGDTVSWNFPSGIYTHTTTECGGNSCDDAPPGTPLWDSGVVGAGGSYMTPGTTFNTPGVYLYQCTIHTSLMRGQITVMAASVGGVAELSPGDSSPAATTDATGTNVALIAGLAVASALASVALGWGARFAAKRMR